MGIINLNMFVCYLLRFSIPLKGSKVPASSGWHLELPEVLLSCVSLILHGIRLSLNTGPVAHYVYPSRR